MTLVAKVASSSAFRVVAREYMPALFIRTSRCPCSFSTCVTAAAMDESEVTSSWMLDVVPLMPVAWISELAFCPFSRERLAIMTWYLGEAEAMTLDAA